MVRHAKSANIGTVKNQLTFAYQGTTAKLRAVVDPPSATMTISSFIQVLELEKDTWFEMSRPLQQRLQDLPPQYQRNDRGFQQGLRQGQQNGNHQGQQSYGNQPYNFNSLEAF